MKLLITGGSGFIGSHLCTSLEAEDVKVQNFSRAKGNDLTKDSLLQLDKVDTVIHLASKSFIPDAFEMPEVVYLENYKSMISILEYCRIKKIKKLIFFSSYVYGKPNYLPIDEKHKTLIKNPYGRSKLHCEYLCQAYSEDYDIDVLVLRPFNIFGLGQKSKFLFPTIINQLLDSNEKSIKVENTNTKRDYLYIKDVISALKKIIFSYEFADFSILNLGYGKSYSVKEIIEMIKDVYDIDKKIIDKRNIRKNEVMECYADISKIKKELSWRPKYNLREGIFDMKNHHLSN